MVGGTDYVETNYNRATAAQRQPGSAWKLFVYLAALEAGYTPDDRVVDTPVTIDGWSPRNSNGKNMGETNLRSEEHTSELQSLMRISYAVFCLKKKRKQKQKRPLI